MASSGESGLATPDPTFQLEGPRALEALIELTALLSSVSTFDEIAQLVADRALTTFGAVAGFVAVPTPDGAGLEMLAHVRPSAGGGAQRCTIDIAESLPVTDAWRLGLPVLCCSREDLYARYPGMDQSRTEREAHAALPLRVDEQNLGVLALTFGAPRAFDQSELSVMSVLTQLCGQALRRVQLTQEVESLRRDFVVTASHELRTPLAAIYGAAVTLQREDVTLGPQIRRELMETVQNQAERMVRVIEDLRLTTELEGDSIILDIEHVDFAEVARNATTFWRQHRDMAPRLQVVEPDEPLVVNADTYRLQQVVANLVDNAFKYSPSDAPVLIQLERVPGGGVLSVTDRGAGLIAEHHERAFEKFFRHDVDHRNGVSGTGLGLFICRKLVQGMYGRVWLETPSDGVGLRACIELPAAKGPDLSTR